MPKSVNISDVIAEVKRAGSGAIAAWNSDKSGMPESKMTTS